MTDRELLDYIKSDSSKGIALLIDRFGALVFKICSSVILPVGSEEDAEECANDVFITFYNNIEKIDLSRSSLKGFLAMISKRHAIDFYRVLKRKKEREESLSEEEPYSDEALSFETKAALTKAIKTLGLPDSEIITRKYILGETAEEIGRALGLSKDAVQKRIERSRAKLKEMLGGVFYG